MKTTSILVSMLGAAMLSGCAAAPLVVGGAALATPTIVSSNNRVSDVTDKYTDAQIERCMNSLTAKDQIRIQERVRSAAVVPLVGAWRAEKVGAEEAEKICKEKGII